MWLIFYWHSCLNQCGATHWLFNDYGSSPFCIGEYVAEKSSPWWSRLSLRKFALCFYLKFFLEIDIDSHAVVRGNTEKSCLHTSQLLSMCNMLQTIICHHNKDIDTNTVQWCDSDVPSFARVPSCVCVCFMLHSFTTYRFLYHPSQHTANYSIHTRIAPFAFYDHILVFPVHHSLPPKPLTATPLSFIPNVCPFKHVTRYVTFRTGSFFTQPNSLKSFQAVGNVKSLFLFIVG